MTAVLENRKPSILYDHLQNFPFWIMDVSPIDTLGLPVFLPLFGFSAISAPEISATIRTVKEGNNYFPRKIIEGASVAPITCTRGSHFIDGDFWRWIKDAVLGVNDSAVGPTYRRNLLLVHFFARGPFRDEAVNIALATVGLTTLAAGSALSATSLNGTVRGALKQGVLSSASAFLNAGGFLGFSALSGWAIRIPAKAWLLYDCIPSRYKVGSGFDASSSEVSIAELDIEMERFEEISLTS